MSSLTLFITQMKGRGVRTIGDEQLRNVTPNAHSKDLFFLVDAVGVTEHEHYVTTSGAGSNAETLLSLRQLLERISHGELPDEHLRLLLAVCQEYIIRQMKNRGMSL